MTPSTRAASNADPPPLAAVEPRLLPSRLEAGLRIHGFELPRERPLPAVRCCAGGVCGFGEAPPLPSFTGEDAAATHAALVAAAPRLLGLDPAEALDRLHTPGTVPSAPARAALDVALHDLLARAAGAPLHRLLGERRQVRIRVSRAIGLHPLGTTLDLARGYLRRGVRAFKLKVGGDPAHAAATLRAVRATVGPEVELAADANGGWSRDRALGFWERCADAGLAYLEQPLPRDDLAGLRWLRERGVRIVVDESVFDAADLRRVAAAGAADAVALKLIKCGGLRPALELAAAAAAHDLPLVVVDPLGSALSLNAGLHLAAVLPEAPFAHGLSAGLEVAAPHAPHLPVVDGELVPPDAPGLGARVVWPEGVAA